MSNPTYPATKDGAKQFFHNALAGVASASIRKWALSEHNAPIWEGEALARIKAERVDVTKFTVSILSHAMGL